ncbi:hypothetical protein BC831DRAFT_471549, partial [Entophlyctis helioformis]
SCLAWCLGMWNVDGNGNGNGGAPAERRWCLCMACYSLLWRDMDGVARDSRHCRDLPTMEPSSRQQTRPATTPTGSAARQLGSSATCKRHTADNNKQSQVVHAGGRYVAVCSRPTTISSCTTTVARCQPSRTACRWHDTATSAATQQGDGGATRTTTSSKGGGGRSSDSRTGGMGSRDMQGICKRCIGNEGRACSIRNATQTTTNGTSRMPTLGHHMRTQTEAAHRGSRQRQQTEAADSRQRQQLETHPKVRQGCSGRPASHESGQYDH